MYFFALRVDFANDGVHPLVFPEIMILRFGEVISFGVGFLGRYSKEYEMDFFVEKLSLGLSINLEYIHGNHNVARFP